MLFCISVKKSLAKKGQTECHLSSLAVLNEFLWKIIKQCQFKPCTETQNNMLQALLLKDMLDNYVEEIMLESRFPRHGQVNGLDG